MMSDSYGDCSSSTGALAVPVEPQEGLAPTGFDHTIADDLRASVIFLLESEPMAVRVHEGGCAEENLGASLAITMQRMRAVTSDLLEVAQLVVETADFLIGTTAGDGPLATKARAALAKAKGRP